MEMKSEECTLVSNPTFREPSFKPLPVSAAPPIRLAPPVRYRECLKNHAASTGGNVQDGCGEFMPGGAEGTFQALQCAACACHRNFHRKEPMGGGGAMDLAPPPLLQLPPPLRQRDSGHCQWSSFVSPMKVAFGSGGSGGGGSESSSEEMGFGVAGVVVPPVPPYGMSKKRHRTKFTQEQKMKMLEYAERVGWRIPREDDIDVQRFCSEVGVKRQVFKVWMHNNKSNTKKQIQEQP